MLYLLTWTVDPNVLLEYDFHDGVLINPVGSIDAVHFTSAAVSGVVELSDGSSVPINLAWDFSGTDVQVSGNDGPYNVGNGIDPHWADRCGTLNAFAHQRFRTNGTVVGSIGGTDVNALFLEPHSPFIEGKSVFAYMTVNHGRC